MSGQNIFIQSSYHYDWLDYGFRHFSKYCITKWPEMSSSITNMNRIVLFCVPPNKTYLQLKRLWVLELPDFVFILGTTVLYFLLGFGIVRLTSFHFILNYKTGVYKPTALKLLPFAGWLQMQQCHLTYLFTFSKLWLPCFWSK